MQQLIVFNVLIFSKKTSGVVSTSVGYAGGDVENPSYQDVCTGLTGHAEVVRIVFDPSRTSYKQMLDVFWDNHEFVLFTFFVIYFFYSIYFIFISPPKNNISFASKWEFPSPTQANRQG